MLESGVGGREHIALDDAGVEDPIRDIGCDETELSKTDHLCQFLVQSELLQQPRIGVNSAREDASSRRRGPGARIPVYVHESLVLVDQ